MTIPPDTLLCSCYHKLTEEDEVLLPAVRRRDGVVDSGSSAGSVLGFPLSRVVQERHTKLMETGRREACHSCERWPVTVGTHTPTLSLLSSRWSLSLSHA